MSRTRMFYLILMLSFGLASLACAKRTEPTTAPNSSSVAPTLSPNNSTTPLPSTAVESSPSSAGTAAGASPTATASGIKSGWWVRINPTLTTAQSITFQIGTNKLDRTEWRVWQPGQPTEFSVPAKYVAAPRLYLRGNVTPIGKIADLCLMYKDRGVEHMDFNDDESETKSQLQTDLKCSVPR